MLGVQRMAARRDAMGEERDVTRAIRHRELRLGSNGTGIGARTELTGVLGGAEDLLDPRPGALEGDLERLQHPSCRPFLLQHPSCRPFLLRSSSNPIARQPSCGLALGRISGCAFSQVSGAALLVRLYDHRRAAPNRHRGFRRDPGG